MHTCQCVYVCSWAYRSVRFLEKKRRNANRADSSVLCTAVFIIALSVAATDSGSIQRKQAEDGGGARVSQRVRFGSMFFPRSHYPVYQLARGRDYSTQREDIHQMPSLVFRWYTGERFQCLYL